MLALLNLRGLHAVGTANIGMFLHLPFLIQNYLKKFIEIIKTRSEHTIGLQCPCLNLTVSVEEGGELMLLNLRGLHAVGTANIGMILHLPFPIQNYLKKIIEILLKPDQNIQLDFSVLA